MEEGSEQDKSELPTPYKLEKARKKGMVARGMDLAFLTSMAALLCYSWVAGPRFGASMQEAARDAFVGGASLTDSRSALLVAAGTVFSPAIRPLMLLIASVFLVVLVSELVQTGVVFSSQPLKPDFNRLNPANGLKRIFTARMLIETLKNVLKLAAYGAVAYLVITGALHKDIGAVTDGATLLTVMTRVGIRLLAAFVLVAAFFAILDQILARQQFTKKMRMNRRELKREARDREGEPRIKQKRKQLHREYVKSSQSLKNLRKADVLITNPEHIALALHYDAKTMHAPRIVSVGVNQFAQRLKRLAFLYAIPIFESRTLARELYRHGVLNGTVPESCFKQVADIYNAVRRQSRPVDAEHAEGPVREEPGPGPGVRSDSDPPDPVRADPADPD
jgi:flagellar biosynthetic protein FlhB